MFPSKQPYRFSTGRAKSQVTELRTRSHALEVYNDGIGFSRDPVFIVKPCQPNTVKSLTRYNKTVRFPLPRLHVVDGLCGRNFPPKMIRSSPVSKTKCFQRNRRRRRRRRRGALKILYATTKLAATFGRTRYSHRADGENIIACIMMISAENRLCFRITIVDTPRLSYCAYRTIRMRRRRKKISLRSTSNV